MNKWAPAPCIVLVLLVGLSKAQGDDGPLKSRFLAEYAGAIRSWELRCANAVGTVKYTVDDTRRKGRSHGEELDSFKCKFPHMDVWTSTNLTDASSRQSVSGINKNYSFILKRMGTGGDYSVESLKSVDVARREPRRSTLTNLLWSPYAGVSPNSRLVSSPRFVIKAISSLTRNNKQLAKVEFDYPNDPDSKARKNANGHGGYEGFFIVSPQEKWVLYEFEWREKKGSTPFCHKGTIEYQGIVDGFPIPKRILRQLLKLPTSELVATYSYDFQSFDFIDLADREFTLAAFGIPEEVARPTKAARGSASGYWFIALALASLVAAVAFKIASSRVTRRSAA